ncbi:MAG: XdhC family protein [Coriobacteriales bacterium]|jgi:xanthine dehydrogenase accessory factor|nr:XdhC family protein [Coriobacteriales bacterium]
MTRTLKQTLSAIKDDLAQGRRPQATPAELLCFSQNALTGNPDISPEYLEVILDSLGPEDIPTFEAALDKLNTREPAWLGFKVVTNAALALDSVDTEVVGIQGKGAGSADAVPGVFVATEDKQIIFSRPYSERDRFQMLDITRGPHMHNEQYIGLAWLSMPLMSEGRVFMFGAGEVSHFIERMAADCDFETIVIDDDAAYLNAERLPLSRRVLLESFATIPDLDIDRSDYILVLTRGHMHDPEALIYGIKTGAQYVGMMGCLEKNERVFSLAQAKGIDRAQLEATHTPIGLKFGAKTPAELALCIVAELIQVRYENRKKSQDHT